MPNEVSQAQGVDLNTASDERLSTFCGIGSEIARRIIQARPLRGWDDIARLEGFSPQLLRELQHAGARIGGAGGGGDRPRRDHAS